MDMPNNSSLEELSRNKAHGGWQGVYKHKSSSCNCDMVFGLYLPPNAKKAPLLWYLSGLTCTHENAMTKANLQYFAAQSGLALIFPDTSPRGEGVADDEAYDLGQGAGFYLNATEAPWAAHFQMYDYIAEELPGLIASEFDDALDMARQGITGHSMGGHGALTIAIKNPDRFTSLSAFAPIANPSASDWGRKQFASYLGSDETKWAEYDAVSLLAQRGWKGDILVDQGADDQFIELLCPGALAEALAEKRQGASLRTHKGYDHSYFFVASFAGDHVDWHAERLKAGS